MKNQIISTVFSHNKKEFSERFAKLIKISKNLQIDFMDGIFVKGKSFKISQMPNLKGKGNFEAHLMVINPIKYIKSLKSIGFKKIIFHFNSGDNVKTIAEIRKSGMKPFLALNPEDKVSESFYLFQLVDGILLMGVHPGEEHQKLIPAIYNKIKEIRKIDKNIIIQIDGGVHPTNIKKLKKAGANIFNSGSFVSDAENPHSVYIILKREIMKK